MGLFDNLREKYIVQPVVKSFNETIKGGSVAKLGNDTNMTPTNDPVSWNVPYNYNAQYFNKVKPGGQSTYEVLRNLSRFYEGARACINIKKSQITQLEYDFMPLDEADKTDYSKVVPMAKQWLRSIGGHNISFSKFMDKVVEDFLVIDGVSLYKNKTFGGALANLTVIDPTTIKLRVDESGNTPVPPDIAFEQWFRGNLHAKFTTDQMYYFMLNPHSDSPYGLSPLETLVIIAESALKGNLYTQGWFTDGTVPAGFLSVPLEWNLDQINAYSEWLDTRMAGDSRNQNKLLPIYQGMEYTPAKDFDFSNMQPFLEWLLKLTDSLFGVMPQELGLTDTVNKATSEEQGEIAKRNSIKGFAIELEEIINTIMHEQPLILTENGKPTQEFVMPNGLVYKFLDLDPKDEAMDAQIAQGNINMGMIGINEWRSQKGLEPIEGGEEPFIMTPQGPILIKNITSLTTVTPPEEEPKAPETPAPEDTSTPKEELQRWQKKALSDYKEGRPFRKFHSTVLNDFTLVNLPEDLKKAGTREEIKEVFEKWNKAEEEGIVYDAKRLFNKLERL